MLSTKNQDIRCEISDAGLRLWQIADALGMADSNFSRKLRRELPDAEKKQIRDIIKRLKGEANNAS